MTCVFCEEKGYLETELLFARFDKFPVSPGHTLIIPFRHAETWFDLRKEEQLEVIDLIDKVKAHLDAEHEPDGYNIGMNCGEVAGQTVPHAHIHVIPRYKNDMDNPRGGIRGVIPDKQQYE